MKFPLQYPPGVVSDDTIMARGGRYIDADKVRWVRERPQLIGGWERLIRTAVDGICRTTFAWSDNSGRLNIAFGTHTKLMVWRGGVLSDITPYGPPVRLGLDPFAVSNGSAVVTVTHTAHGYANATPIKVYGATAGGGITVVGGPFTITVINANSYSFTFTSPASSTDSTTGGAEVVIIPQTALPAGQTNGTGTSGYGTGAYGVGGFGQPSEDDYFPRTWSFGLLGQALVAHARDGAMYLWENDTAARATWLEGSPLRSSAIMTTPERVIFALGTEEEASPHTYNPRCIRNSDYRDETIWYTDTDTLAREKILEGAGRIVAGRTAGYANFIFTDNEVYQAAYVGEVDEVYSFSRLGEDCGLIGPNAACVRNQRAYWLTPDLQFMTVALGGEPSALECPMRDELREYLAPAQRDKVVASTLSSFSEVWFFYPDRRDGLENSRAIFFSSAEGWWSKAELPRTAFCDAGPSDFPVGVDPSGWAYWHERGTSNDGNRIAWRLTAGPQYIDSGQNLIFFRSFWPDFQGQVGSIDLTFQTREWPQSDPVEHGPYAMAPGDQTVILHGTGRLVSWGIEGDAGPAEFRLGTPILEGRAVGRGRG